MEFGDVGFEEGGKPENSEKNPRSKARTNNKLNPHMVTGGRGERGRGGGEGAMEQGERNGVALSPLRHS